jgi:Family of unknown function (DUF6221)
VSDLTEFLLARIAQDEAVAREVEKEQARVHGIIWGGGQPDRDRSFWADYDGAGPSVSVGPARVLAECEAKRRIIASRSWPEPRAVRKGGEGDDYDVYDYGDSIHFAHKNAPPDLILRLLALPYADHPDFRAEWRVSP